MTGKCGWLQPWSGKVPIYPIIKLPGQKFPLKVGNASETFVRFENLYVPAVEF